jgi:hypothetical protein
MIGPLQDFVLMLIGFWIAAHMHKENRVMPRLGRLPIFKSGNDKLMGGCPFSWVSSSQPYSEEGAWTAQLCHSDRFLSLTLPEFYPYNHLDIILFT